MPSWDALGMSVLVLNVWEVVEFRRDPMVSLALGMKSDENALLRAGIRNISTV